MNAPATTCAWTQARLARGEEADLRFTITEDGEAVHTEPYLGAGGHLVAQFRHEGRVQTVAFTQDVK